jgi:hypothetical protein
MEDVHSARVSCMQNILSIIYKRKGGGGSAFNLLNVLWYVSTVKLTTSTVEKSANVFFVCLLFIRMIPRWECYSKIYKFIIFERFLSTITTIILLSYLSVLQCTVKHDS